MAGEKPNWAKTNVNWGIRKVIWQRWALGETVKDSLKFFQLHKTEYEDAPWDRNTVAAVRNELASLPFELLHKLLEEIPETRTFLMQQRPDFKEKIELSQQPQSQLGSPTHITVIPKRKIKRRIIESKTVDGKVQVTDSIELDYNKNTD